jgi:hypothetical protein
MIAYRGSTRGLLVGPGLPDELTPLLVGSWTVEYASVKGDGTPVTQPLIPTAGEDGRTIDVNTGLAYPTKAERARSNPRVCLLYSDRRGAALSNPPVALVYGHATVHDANLQANTDRAVRMYLDRMPVIARMPRLVLRQLYGYLARIWIVVTPLKVLWWPGGDMDVAPGLWAAPRDTRLPASDPPPRPLERPHPLVVPSGGDWRRNLSRALDTLGPPILTVIDDDGYPVPFRVKQASRHGDGVHLELHPAMPARPQGRACLTFHTIGVIAGSMVSNDNMAFVGRASIDGAGALFTAERQLIGVRFRPSPGGLLALTRMMLSFRTRLAAEAARRGQPVPIVRLPDEYEIRARPTPG